MTPRSWSRLWRSGSAASWCRVGGRRPVGVDAAAGGGGDGRADRATGRAIGAVERDLLEHEQQQQHDAVVLDVGGDDVFGCAYGDRECPVRRQPRAPLVGLWLTGCRPATADGSVAVELLLTPSSVRAAVSNEDWSGIDIERSPQDSYRGINRIRPTTWAWWRTPTPGRRRRTSPRPAVELPWACSAPASPRRSVPHSTVAGSNPTTAARTSLSSTATCRASKTGSLRHGRR